MFHNPVQACGCTPLLPLPCLQACRGLTLRTAMAGKFRFAIDRGGTFTDVYAELPGKTRALGR